MYNSQYYTCEQIDQRLLQGYLDDYNTENNTSLTKAQFLSKLGSILGVWQGVDDEPTADSNNMVKSGGVQKELALGAVYDVSAKNPTAGPNNDGKFESLSALLSDNNLNTLIPTAVRNGGMSIKFIQSSDNNYVQYRLTSSTFTTKISKWVNEPIAEEIKTAINLSEATLERIGAGTNGFITSTGDLDTSITNAFYNRYKVKEGYGLKVTASSPDAPRNDARLWAIYSSDTVFDSTTCIAISNTNAKNDITESVVVPANAKVLILQHFYSGANKVRLLQNTATKTADDLEALTKVVANKKRSNVFLQSAIVNTSLSDAIKDKYLDGIVSLKIKGISNQDKYIVSSLVVGTYNTNYFIKVGISKIENNALTSLVTFYSVFSSIPSDNRLKFLGFESQNSQNIYFAECCVDLAKIGTTLFNNTINTVDTDTYKNYGIIPDCFEEEDFDSALPSAAKNSLRKELRKIEIKNLDTTREYLLKTFGYNPSTGYLALEICTTDNFLSVYSINKPIGTEHRGIETIINNNSRITLDFNILNNSFYRVNVNAQSLPPESTNKLTILGYNYDTKLLAEEELALTFNSEPMKLLDYGDISKKFYLSCGRSLFATSSICKQAYTENDIDKCIELVYTFSDSPLYENQYDYFVGINTVKELNNGQLIVNAAVNSYNDNTLTNYSTYSIFYRWDGSTMNKLFVGSWRYYTFSSGIGTKRGGYWTGIWDFDNYENLVFIAERCDQGTGGRAWMSKDGGYTWYVIFNAFTDTNYELYKVVQPSGWDSEHNDFQRPVPGTGNPNSNFHIHGIAYDRWRDNVVIVSGDATWVKGSYTAVWILHNPAGCTIYPASGDIPEGATRASNPVKMLQCTWTRVGLYNDENPTGKNLQFVNTLPFENFILFGSDCGGGGVNGILVNTYPQNIVGSNFGLKYPLNADNDNAITHCSSGILKLKNGPYLWTFHREGGGFSPTSSDQKAAILSSYDGVTWVRAWDDDTFNYDGNRGTKVKWGATMIGYLDEMYLRYKGNRLTDNVIRRMTLRD